MTGRVPIPRGPPASAKQIGQELMLIQVRNVIARRLNLIFFPSLSGLHRITFSSELNLNIICRPQT